MNPSPSHVPPGPPLAVAAVATAALLAGCATPIADSVVQANLAQEQAANQLLLLNIARAHQHMPLHFSQIGQIRAAPGGWGLGVPSLGLELPFGGAAERKYTLTAGNEGSSPVDLSALNNQEFMRGITTPVVPETLDYFLNQGWPAPVLLHLFLESVTLKMHAAEGGTVLRQLRNDPGQQDHAAFRDFVNDAANCAITLEPQEGKATKLSSPVRSVGVRDGVEAAKAKLQIVEEDEVPTTAAPPAAAASAAPRTLYRLVQVDSTLALQLKPQPGTGVRNKACPPPAVASVGASPAAAQTALNTPRKLLLASNAPALPARRTAPATGRAAPPPVPMPTDVEQFVLRSPASMLYYLGQLSRAQNRAWFGHGLPDPSGLLLVGNREGRAEVLFRMSDKSDIAAPAVAVKYQDKTYAVPPYNGDPSQLPLDRSVSTLALMGLVLNLQDKGAEAPGASSVRVVK